MKKVFFLVLSLQLFAAFAKAQIQFIDRSHRLTTPTNSKLVMAVTDMNNDNLDDIIRFDHLTGDVDCPTALTRVVISTQVMNNYTIYPEIMIEPTVPEVKTVCIADLNQDGYRDIFSGGAGYVPFIWNVKPFLTQTLSTTNNIIHLPSTYYLRENFLQGSNIIDIDKDGDLDIFAAQDNHVSTPYLNNGSFNFAVDFTYLNPSADADHQTCPVTSENMQLNNPYHFNPSSGNYGSVWSDITGDRIPELYISKCRGGVDDPNAGCRVNQLFEKGNSTFYVETAASRGLAFGEQSWAADFADIDNDGDMDCYLINHGDESFLLQNDGNGNFTNITPNSGLSGIRNGFQAIFEDFDNDTYVDLLLTRTGGANGQGMLFHNQSGTSFAFVADFVLGSNGGSNPALKEIVSAAVGDFNNDGFLDIYADYDGRNDALLFNKQPVSTTNKRSVKVKLVGSQPANRDAIGAILVLEHPSWGNKKQTREVRSGESYGIMNSLNQHFGVDNLLSGFTLTVYWPSGATKVYPNITTYPINIITE